MWSVVESLGIRPELREPLTVKYLNRIELKRRKENGATTTARLYLVYMLGIVAPLSILNSILFRLNFMSPPHPAQNWSAPRHKVFGIYADELYIA